MNLGIWIGKESNKALIICFMIVMLVSILYFNSLGNQFTNWDDGMIYDNSSIRNLNWEGITKIFTLQKTNNYQPIRMLSYAIDYHFWKLNPLGYHITNIFFYILTCIMVFFTIKLLSRHLRTQSHAESHLRVALFGSLLFAAHPVHVEAVTWLVGRKEVLQGFFFFLAFFLYIRGREEQGLRKVTYLSFVLVVFVLAVLSKPAAVIFPGVIFLYEITVGKERVLSFVKKYWVFISVALIVSAIFTFIMIKVMFEAGGIKHYRGNDISSNLLVCLYVFLHAIKLLTLTINYSAAYSLAIALPFFCTKNLFLMIITLCLFATSVFSFLRKRIVFFSFFFFLITLLPYLNIIPISTLKADRYVFIGSLSWVFLLGVAFERMYAYRQKKFSEGFFKLLSLAIFLFLLGGYSFMTIRQNNIWENSYTLWADAVEKHPESSTANALMGVVYMGLGMDQQAVEYLEKAVKLFPSDYLSRNNLGIVYGRMDQPEKALKELMTAIWLKPEDDTIKINLSAFYQRQKEYKKSEEILKYLLSKDPKNANLNFRLGLLYKEAGQYEQAVSELKKAMELAPNIINPYEEMGNIYLSKFKDAEKAKYYYTKGIEMAPKAKSKVEDLRRMIQDLESYR